VWTSLICEIVGYDTVYNEECGPAFCDIVGYDILYNDECGPVYFVILWVMTLCIRTSVDQFIL